MKAFTRLDGRAAPLSLANIDTDQIIPAQFLKTVEREGLGRGLFFGFRYDDDGKPREDFVLNRPEFAGTKILIAGDNFGCGSSREHAPWALADFGIRCVIAPSFGDIFRANCLKNGILLIHLPRAVCERLVAVATDRAGEAFTVDLERQRIELPDGDVVRFEIGAPDRETLLTGTDEIVRSLRHEDRISAYEARLADADR